MNDDSLRGDGGHLTEEVTPSVNHDIGSLTGIQLRTIAWIEFRLGLRQRWLPALTGVFVLFGLLLVVFTGARVGPSGMDRTLASMTNLLVYLVPLVALAYGFDAIVGREASGWLAALITLPIARWRIPVGIYLGRAFGLAGAMAVGLVVTGIAFEIYVGAVPWRAFGTIALGAIALGLAFLAIAVALSSIASAKTHALGGALAIWMWFVLIHDLISLGFIARFALADQVLAGLILANPAGTFRVLALDAAGAGGTAGYAGVMAEVGLSVPLLVVGLIGWTVLPVAIAVAVISTRRWSV